MDKAREAAVFALERTRRDGAWSSALSDAMKTKYDLDSRSLSLAVSISLGVLQSTALLDYYIDLNSKSASKIEPKVRDIMRSGAYQLIFMDKIPASAAVNESVALCKKLGYSRASGFCNAVLRKIASCADKLPEPPGKGTAQYLSVKYSHPRQLAQYIIDRRGYDAAEAFLAADNTIPDTCLQVNTLKITPDELMARLLAESIPCSMHPWLPDCIVTAGSVSSMPGFDEGLFYVQDPAAKCAVLAAALEPGMYVLDSCAAPGGKSFAAAIAMRNEGSIDSCDLHDKKIRLISEGAQRLGLSCINAFLHDAREPFYRQYDAIIADVPCSGYGVIRKKPEIRYKPLEDSASMPAIQAAILENLSQYVKPGGVIVYSTCTVLERENEDVVKAFLRAHAEFSAEGFTLPNGETAADGDGYITFWPDIHGTDGFFVSKLRRNK